MKQIHGLHNITAADHGSVVSIGNFDGVHRGHKAVLAELRKKADELNLPSTLVIFEPHPKEFFTPDAAPARLTNAQEKLGLLEHEGLDTVLVIAFTEEFSKLSAERFIRELLVEKLGVKYLLVGEDFHFGYKRQGNYDLLKAESAKHNFEVVTVSTLFEENERISSTCIRNALAAGEFAEANKLLGYEYSISGTVEKGEQNGRTIGFPTANMALNRIEPAVRGVFAVSVEGLGEKQVKGVANLGTRPTVDGLKTLLEVNLFDFNEDIYGKNLKVIFHKKIREEKKFDSFDALREQIIKDVKIARHYHD